MAEQRITVPVVSLGGSKVGDVDVPAAVLSGPLREPLLHEVVRSQLASRRAGTAATKTRGLVSGGGKKPWRQKGTGRARAGSSRSPLWAGGGTIFGPQPRSYAYRLPKTARRAALRAAVAARHSTGKLLVVDGLQLAEAKTKRMVECLHGLGLDGQSVLIVLAQANDAVQRAARNLPRVKVLLVGGLNVYDVLGHATLVMTREALDRLVDRLRDDEGGRA
jgi:large subunit ribosomal protein L4